MVEFKKRTGQQQWTDFAFYVLCVLCILSKHLLDLEIPVVTFCSVPIMSAGSSSTFPRREMSQ